MGTKNLIPFLAAALLAACAHPAPAPQPQAELASPDGALRLEFFLDADGVPYYALSRDGVDVLLPSRLGFKLRGTVKAERLAEDNTGRILKSDAVPPVDFDRGFEFAGTDTDSFDEVWEPVWGEESQIRNHYNELLVHLRQPDGGRALDIRFRLFDDGLGFRYEFPGGQSLVHFVIQEELTEFACADDWTAWWIPGDYDTQEYEYNCTKLSEVAAQLQNTIINVIAWIAAVVVSFPMNRKWVFQSRNPAWIHEFLGFTASRITTLLIEELIMLLCVNLLGIDFRISKIFIASVLVIILNYVFSKLLVFRKGQKDQ